MYSECLLVAVSAGRRVSGQRGGFSLDMTSVNEGKTRVGCII